MLSFAFKQIETYRHIWQQMLFTFKTLLCLKYYHYSQPSTKCTHKHAYKTFRSMLFLSNPIRGNFKNRWPLEYTRKSLVTSLQIYVIVVRNQNNLVHILSFWLWKQTIRCSTIGIFLLYTTATAMFYQRFCQLN